MKSLLTLLTCAILYCGPFAAAETYDSRIAEKEILTPAPHAIPCGQHVLWPQRSVRRGIRSVLYDLSVAVHDLGVSSSSRSL